MSANTTNQQITYPVGTDLADNPTAFLDMLADVEGRLVQRYTSDADRLARNPTPALGEMSIVTSNTWYDRWTGVKWLPCTVMSKAKVADQNVNNSTVVVNDTELFLPVPTANSRFAFRLGIRYVGNNTADIKFTFTGPAGATITFGGIGPDTAATSGANASTNFVGAIPPATLAYSGDASGAWMQIHGSLLTAAATGILQLQWAQNVANVSNTTVQAFSFIQMWALG